MRLATAIALGLGLGTASLMLAGSPASAEFYCSDGFEPTSGGRCIAVAARDEIQLYLNDPVEDSGEPVHHRRHRHHGLHERY